MLQLSGNEGPVDLWILSRLSQMVCECDKAFTSLSLHQGTKALHQFWLTEFCDVYLVSYSILVQALYLFFFKNVNEQLIYSLCQHEMIILISTFVNL